MKTIGDALGPSIERYLAHKKALGYQYTMERWTLLHWDAFLHRHQRGSGQTVDSQTFGCWARALARLAPRVQRSRLRIVRSFLLYHARDHAVTFIPDLATFPKASPTRTPRLVSPAEMANLLATATQLPPSPYNPLRSQTIRVALILLFCCGLRRGELQRLTLKHVDARQNQLHVENTKFHKSRWVPLPDSVAQEVRNYLELRRQEQFCAEPDSYLIPRRRSSASTSTRSAGEGITQIWQHLCITVGVVDERGRPPRLHDLRHHSELGISAIGLPPSGLRIGAVNRLRWTTAWSCSPAIWGTGISTTRIGMCSLSPPPSKKAATRFEQYRHAVR